MKRFLVFAADTYYPVGGWSEFARAFDLQSEAETYADWLVSGDAEHSWDWAEVVDLETLTECYCKHND
jgi:hypothetical protein